MQLLISIPCAIFIGTNVNQIFIKLHINAKSVSSMYTKYKKNDAKTLDSSQLHAAYNILGMKFQFYWFATAFYCLQTNEKKQYRRLLRHVRYLLWRSLSLFQLNSFQFLWKLNSSLFYLQCRMLSNINICNFSNQICR